MVTTTVCSVGCLMSSISAALAGRNITIAGSISTPGTLNAWLRSNGGYDSDNDLEDSAVPNIDPTRIAWPADGMHVHNDLSMNTIRAYLVRGRVVIANVDAGHHFVLVTGWDYQDEDRVLVNDSGFNRTSYSYSTDVVGWRIFDMS
jgi:hypothetical protein